MVKTALVNVEAMIMKEAVSVQKVLEIKELVVLEEMIETPGARITSDAVFMRLYLRDEGSSTDGDIQWFWFSD